MAQRVRGLGGQPRYGGAGLRQREGVDGDGDSDSGQRWHAARVPRYGVVRCAAARGCFGRGGRRAGRLGGRAGGAGDVAAAVGFRQDGQTRLQPGRDRHVHGVGLESGEVVTLVLHEDPWFDDHPVLTATADKSGNMSNNQFVPDAHDVNVQFFVTASGQTSGLVAQATFTDAALPSNVKLQQWETLPTGNWTTGSLGSSNSDYAEGEVVPFRLDEGGLATSGNPYTFSVCRDFQSGTKRGYLFLAPFNTSRAAAPGGTITSTNGAFNGVNVTINSVTEVGGQRGCGTGQRETSVSVNSTGNATAFVLWGGHLAAPSDVFEGQQVGPGNGAASFPGSNLHMNPLSPNKTVAIKPGAVKPGKATPALVTTPTPTSGTVGVTLNDAATLSGGSSPTGSITFTLYDPDQATCTGTPRFTQTVTVTGNGTYSTTGGFATDKPGTWRWRASYSGDASNNPASTGCNDEP